MNHDENDSHRDDHLKVCMTCRIREAITYGNPANELNDETGNEALNALAVVAAFLLSHGSDDMAESWADWVLELRERAGKDGFGLGSDKEASLQ